MESFFDIYEKEYIWFEIDGLPMENLLSRIKITDNYEAKNLEMLEQFIYTLSKIVDYKTEFTASHSLGVGFLAFKLAKLCGLSDEKSREIKIAGYLHDIGKVMVPTEILLKPGALTTEEFNIIKAHPYYTYSILKNIKGLEDIAKWAGAHHEKMDCSGYPYKLGKAEIGIEIQIIAYADYFVALSENRVYRKGLSLKKIMELINEELRENMGEEVYIIVEKYGELLYKELSEIREKSLREYRDILLGNKI